MRTMSRVSRSQRRRCDIPSGGRRRGHRRRRAGARPAWLLLHISLITLALPWQPEIDLSRHRAPRLDWIRFPPQDRLSCAARSHVDRGLPRSNRRRQPLAGLVVDFCRGTQLRVRKRQPRRAVTLPHHRGRRGLSPRQSSVCTALLLHVNPHCYAILSTQGRESSRLLSVTSPSVSHSTPMRRQPRCAGSG